ncbi:unnamed protein product [Caenorhabditis angaria]|uniref:Uncharacterized protein n=1 Tax=Caenorhabditis angaria TaxID=860376 RepID=A0A9P1J2K2_9PELO|nr:unnamed protein product [Caenorhabditis angaria]
MALDSPTSKRHNITFSLPMMSRLRSDTYIKPGSESSYESEDGNSRRYAQPTLDSYCCISNVSIKKAVIISGVLSAVQSIVNFFLLLRGCDRTNVDIAFAILPIVTATGAILFLSFALLHNSSISLKPYIAHHLLILLCGLGFFIYYVLFLFHYDTNWMSWLARQSNTFQTLMTNQNDSKLLYGVILVIQISTNILCIHISVGLYLVLDNVVRYVSAEVTEVI